MTLDASDDELSGSTISAAGFINSLGVDTHLPYTDGGYANIANVAADLAYLGLSNVRDSITDGESGSAPLSTYTSLAMAGVKFTFLTATGGAVTTATLNATLSLIDQVNEAVPGSVTAVEGANEINNYPITFNGETDELTAAVELQQAIYADVHSDPNLMGVSVDYFTGYDAYSPLLQELIGPGPNPAQTPGLADFDNQHPYPTADTVPAIATAPSYALQNELNSDGFGPAVYTETGYSTNLAGGVDQDVQAKYTLDLLFDAAADGISQTFLYQLMDAYAPGSPQGDDGYGLFDSNNAPKEVAVGIHNLTTILADPDAPAGFIPTPLAYAVANLPTTGHSIAFEKSTGVYDIAIYDEADIWDAQTQTQTAVNPQIITVEFGSTVGMIEVFAPLVSALPLATLYNVSEVELGLADEPLIVEIEADPVACYVRGTRILTLRGEVAVEELQMGDLVATFSGMGAPLKSVRWMGHRRIDLRRHPDPENTQPIHFRAGALDEGCPRRDLMVSPGHRMRVGNVLVTALELVNGASILQESLDEAEYWHIELDRHELVLAEGVQAETYVDTGNRSAFENAAAVTLHPLLDGHVPGPCLPYAGASAAMRAHLFARAETMGWLPSIDPAPWLDVDGQRIEPARQGDRCQFSLPAGSRHVRLRSRAGRPWDVFPHSGDRRQLGLKLHHLALGSRDGVQTVALDAPGLKEGFNRVEHDEADWAWRWTNGDALLPLAELAPGRTVTMVEIAYDQALPLWLAPALPSRPAIPLEVAAARL